MNDLVHVKKSSIHGRGLFARKDIPADALLGALEGVPTERDGAYVVWAIDATGSRGLRITNVLRFLWCRGSPWVTWRVCRP